MALVAQQYPALRNVTLRLLEPLGAREETDAQEVEQAIAPLLADTEAQRPQGVAVRFEGVSVQVAGHTVLEEIDLRIEAGSHVAIVGPSGAGKSSLVGLLLGWHRPAHGRILVDGEPQANASNGCVGRPHGSIQPCSSGTTLSLKTSSTVCPRTLPRRSAGLLIRLTSTTCSRNCLRGCKHLLVRGEAWSQVERGSEYGWGERCSGPGCGW